MERIERWVEAWKLGAARRRANLLNVEKVNIPKHDTACNCVENKLRVGRFIGEVGLPGTDGGNGAVAVVVVYGGDKIGEDNGECYNGILKGIGKLFAREFGHGVSPVVGGVSIISHTGEVSPC